LSWVQSCGGAGQSPTRVHLRHAGFRADLNPIHDVKSRLRLLSPFQNHHCRPAASRGSRIDVLHLVSGDSDEAFLIGVVVLGRLCRSNWKVPPPKMVKVSQPPGTPSPQISHTHCDGHVHHSRARRVGRHPLRPPLLFCASRCAAATGMQNRGGIAIILSDCRPTL